MKKAGWPKAHEVHSPENRTGQAWKPGSVQVIAQRGKETKVFDMPSGLFRCKKCNEVVRIDERGFAACGSCGDIYNAGQAEKSPKISNRERKRVNNKLIYDVMHRKD